MVDDGPALSNQRKGAKGAFIPLKQAWLDQVAMDPKLTPAALRVAILLSNGFNSETHETFIGRGTLASKLRIAAPNVSGAVRLLKERGHVLVRTVRRNNHYKMVVLAEPSSPAKAMDKIADNERTGMNIDTQQVLISIPNRYEDQYPNREDNRSNDSAVGAYAPNGVTDDMVLEETRTPKGARLSGHPDNERRVLTNQDALDELVDAYAGPIGDRQLAFAAMMTAIEEGAYHEQLLHLAMHRGDTDEPLDDFLWRQTARGRREYATLREQRDGRVPGSAPKQAG